RGRGAAAERTVVAQRIAPRNDRGVVRRIEGVDAIVPVVAAEAAARQVVLHDVEEVSEAAVDLILPGAGQIVCGAQARSHLVAPAEADALETGQCLVGRQAFLVETDAEV